MHSKLQVAAGGDSSDSSDWVIGGVPFIVCLLESAALPPLAGLILGILFCCLIVSIGLAINWYAVDCLCGQTSPHRTLIASLLFVIL